MTLVTPPAHMSDARRSARVTSLIAGGCALAVAVVSLGLVWSQVIAATPNGTTLERAKASQANRQEASSAQKRGSESAKDVSWEADFERAMVQDVSEYKDTAGQQFVDLTVINATPKANLGATAAACTKDSLSRFPKARTAQCYVYDSSASYAFKNYHADYLKRAKQLKKQGVDLPVGAISNLCWSARSAHPRGGRADVTSLSGATMVQAWGSSGCPGVERPKS